MKRIAVLGANGQVGTEVCIFLRHWAGMEPIAICRNELASAVLRRLGVHCRIGNICQSKEALKLIGDCDAVVDFTLPTGNFNEITASYDRIYSSIFSVMPRETPYILASSQMAIGHSGLDKSIRYRWLPRTVYGATKRWAEKRAKEYSKRYGHSLYVLRLAQVHGLIQSVSESYRNLIQTGVTFKTPTGPSYTVFCFTIAEAIANISLGMENAGTYILESNPTWTWPEVISFLGRTKVNCVDFSSNRPFGMQTLSFLKKRALSNIETLQANFLKYFPNFEMKLRIQKRHDALTNTVQALDRIEYYCLEIVPGILPGKRLKSLTDSRQTMLPLWMLCQHDIEVLEKQYE